MELIPNPNSVKRNIDLLAVLTMMAQSKDGLSVREICDGMRMSSARIKEYVALMISANVIERHKPKIDDKKHVYRHRVLMDHAGIEAFLANLAMAHAKPFGNQRQSIRMPAKIGRPKKTAAEIKVQAKERIRATLAKKVSEATTRKTMVYEYGDLPRDFFSVRAA